MGCWVLPAAPAGALAPVLAGLCRAATAVAVLLTPFLLLSLSFGVTRGLAGVLLAARLLRRFGPEPARSPVAAALAALAARTGVRPPAAVLVPGPGTFTAGMRRPVVVLSRALAEQLDGEELEAVLAHELAHIRAGDHWKKWLAVLLRDVLLFTGLSPLAFGHLQLEMEADADACSARVTGKPLALASALLKGWRLGAGGGRPRGFALQGVSRLGGEGEVRRRVRALLEQGAPGPRRSAPRHGRVRGGNAPGAGRWVVPLVWVLTGALLVPLC